MGESAPHRATREGTRHGGAAHGPGFGQRSVQVGEYAFALPLDPKVVGVWVGSLGLAVFGGGALQVDDFYRQPPAVVDARVAEEHARYRVLRQSGQHGLSQLAGAVVFAGGAQAHGLLEFALALEV